VRLLQGDCLQLLPTIAEGSIDLVIADPPYGVTNQEWDRRLPTFEFVNALWRVLKKDGVLCLHATNPYAAELISAYPAWFREDLVWSKSRATNFASARRRHMRLHELVLVFSREPGYTYNPQMRPGEPYKQRTQKPRTNTAYGKFAKADTRPNAEVTDRYPGSILHCPSPRQQDLVHPTQKPVDLELHLVLTYSNRWDLVLDPCMGSGTTGYAALHEGRDFVGIEGDAGHFKEAGLTLEAGRMAGPCDTPEA
jgi:DNA modification methylase